MVNLIDHTYFREDLSIANANEAGSVVQQLMAYRITSNQKKFLVDLLGPMLYAQFDAWMAAPTVDGKWYDLLHGKMFTTSNGYQIEWVGFQNDEKRSPLANYVYYMYQQNNATQTTAAGESKAQAQNALIADMRDKMVRSWGNMVDMLNGYYWYMQEYFTDDADWQYTRRRLLCSNYLKKNNVLGI